MQENHLAFSKWPPGTVVVQIATYNEAASIGQLLHLIHANLPSAQILVIDDNSPDGTAQIVAQQADEHSYIHLVLRVDRRGLGTATLEGLTFAQQRSADIVIHLDGDLSHNPADLPRLLAALTPVDKEPFDIVIGSRRVAGGNTIGWSVTTAIITTPRSTMETTPTFPGRPHARISLPTTFTTRAIMCPSSVTIRCLHVWPHWRPMSSA